MCNDHALVDFDLRITNSESLVQQLTSLEKLQKLFEVPANETLVMQESVSLPDFFVKSPIFSSTFYSCQLQS